MICENPILSRHVPISYAFQIAYYAFEQCSKCFPIMPQLCSILPDYAPVCPVSCSRCTVSLHKFYYIIIIMNEVYRSR